MIGFNYGDVTTSVNYTINLFIDGIETNIFQTAQGNISQSQFNLSTVRTLQAGDHEISIKMKKTFENEVSGGILYGIMSMTYDAS